MAQFGRPISDLQNTSITGGFVDIDEISASNSDYLYSADNANTTYECGITSTLNDPLTGNGHTFRYQIAEIDGGVLGDGAGSTASVIVSLYQGATLIASDVSRNGTNTWTTHSYTLTTTEANNITDYTNLRLNFSITGGGGSPTNRRGIGVSWAELEIPNVPVFTYEESVILSIDTQTNSSSIGVFDRFVSISGGSDVIISGGKNIDESIFISGGSDVITTYLLLINESVVLTNNNIFNVGNNVDFNNSIILQTDNSVSDNNISELLNISTLTSDISLNIQEGQLFNDNTTLLSNLTFTTDALVSSTFEEYINLNSFTTLESLARKTDKLTIINIGKIIGIGKITGL